MNQSLNNKSREYDLEERTAKFAENIIEFVKAIKRDDINRNIINYSAKVAPCPGVKWAKIKLSINLKNT